MLSHLECWGWAHQPRWPEPEPEPVLITPFLAKENRTLLCWLTDFLQGCTSTTTSHTLPITSSEAYSAVYRNEGNSCFSIHAASLLILQSLDLPHLFSAISVFLKDDVVNKREKKAIMFSLSFFSWTTHNLNKLVLFLRFSLPKSSVTDTSLLETPICWSISSPQLFFLTCWWYPDIYLFISYYADSLLLFWDLIF